MFKKVHVFRVQSEQELLANISSYCSRNSITSGVIIGIIGSLEKAQLSFLVKLPGEYMTVDYTGPLEIVCAQGTVTLAGDNHIIHIHIQISDQEVCRGGHLAEAWVFSTAEVVIGELDYQLYRTLDEYTGLNELVKGD